VRLPSWIFLFYASNRWGGGPMKIPFRYCAAWHALSRRSDRRHSQSSRAQNPRPASASRPIRPVVCDAIAKFPASNRRPSHGRENWRPFARPRRCSGSTLLRFTVGWRMALSQAHKSLPVPHGRFASRMSCGRGSWSKPHRIICQCWKLPSNRGVRGTVLQRVKHGELEAVCSPVSTSETEKRD